MTQSDSGEQDNVQVKNTVDEQAAVPAKKKLHKRTIILIGAGVVGVAAIVVAAWWLGRQSVVPASTAQNTNSAQSQNASTLQKVDTTAVAQDSELARYITPTTGEVWYGQPKPIAAKGWFMDELRSKYDGLTMTPAEIDASLAQNIPDYFEVGTHGGAKIVVVYTSGMAPKTVPHLFEILSTGIVHAIANPAANATPVSAQAVQDYNNELTPKVGSIDTTTHYDSLSMPKVIKLDNGEQLTVPVYYDGLGARGDSAVQTTGVAEKTMATFGGSTLVKVETTYKDTNLTNIGFSMKTPFKTVIGLQYEPNALSLEKYTFDNGAATTVKNSEGADVPDAIHPIARGCGGLSAAVTRADTLTANAITAIGKTSTGRTIYEPKDRADLLLKKAYDEYKISVGDTKEPISFDQFMNIHALMVIEDTQKELLAYVRDGYSMMGGCAKPVVYLYPTTTTDVSVQVGANVVKSDPLYPIKGWRQVTAKPNGELRYQGKAYDSLFWEGTGTGSYPGIVSGTVVTRDKAALTMRLQLAIQGLNQKEVNDFMVYWEPKIPQAPYVRLTWFDTADMNQLAPLAVTPKPDTVIRVFLDMDGYNQPLMLPAQQLTAVPRQGFTVVEWGGLVNDMLK